MKQQIKNQVDFLKKDSDRAVTFGVLFATIILFVYCYFGSFSFFENTFKIANVEYWKIIYHNFMAFVLFFAIGLLVTKFTIKQKLSGFGLQKGNISLGLKIVGVATLIIPLIALSTTLDAGMIATYPPVSFEVCSWWQIVLYFASYFAYYVGWEYLFRGVLLFGTNQKLGALGSILLTTMISALIHTSIAGFGKPMIETLSAIPAGLIFGYVALKTKSIYYGLYMHALIGFLTDVFIHIIV